MDDEMPMLTSEEISANVNSTIDYIEKLQLPRPPQQDRRALLSEAAPEETSSATINDKQVICFEEGFPKQLRDNIMSLTLLAQLAATVACQNDPNKKDDVSAWYKEYEEVLKKTQCFNIQESYFNNYTVKGNLLEVDKALIKVLESLASSQIMTIVKAAMEALTQLKNKDPAKFSLFSRNTQSDHQGGFGMGACTEVDGVAYISFAAFYLDSEIKTDDYLWFHYHTKKSRIFKATSTLMLKPHIDKRILDALTKKFEESDPASYIANLVI